MLSLGATLVLHAAVVAWLLAQRFELPSATIQEADFVWLPTPERSPPTPPSVPALPRLRTGPIAISPRTEPIPDLAVTPFYDFEGTARDVAAAIGGGPSRRTFGGPLEAPPGRPKEETPPSIWPKPLPRVGTTVTTPDGETIIWVSDYCYVSLGSRSLTMRELHEGRQGVRTCVLYQFGGKKKPRDDLFDAIRRPAKPLPEARQKAGCVPGDQEQSCAP